VIDGGATAIGVESTIIACLGEEPFLLRTGGITREAIEHVIGPVRDAATPAAAAGRRGNNPKGRPGAKKHPRPLSPGLLASHYAPRAKVRLEARKIEPGEAALLFGKASPVGLDRAAAVLNLSEAGDLAEAAANLFRHLRSLDASLDGAKLSRIAVSPIPNVQLGEAINDRLRRAAAGRRA
jgi:L-threonylcarbamoyladenylate synthase